MIRPTSRAVLLYASGIPLALFIVIVDPSFWALSFNYGLLVLLVTGTDDYALRLPFLERFVREADKDDSRRSLAERLHFTSERLRSVCKSLGRQVQPPAAVDRDRAIAILSRPEYELVEGLYWLRRDSQKVIRPAG